MVMWLRSVTVVDWFGSGFGTMKVALCLQSVVMALWLQSVADVDQQAIFIDTSTAISSMEVAQCLQSVAVVDR